MLLLRKLFFPLGFVLHFFLFQLLSFSLVLPGLQNKQEHKKNSTDQAQYASYAFSIYGDKVKWVKDSLFTFAIW